MRRIVTFEVPAAAAARARIVALVAAVMPAKEGVDFEVYGDGDDLRLELDDRRGGAEEEWLALVRRVEAALREAGHAVTRRAP